MHELSITQDMLDLVLVQAEQAEAKKVGKINLVIGEMTGIVEECVRFYFGFVSEGTPAEGAELHIKKVASEARCRGCGKNFEIDEFDWTCPHCESKEVEITAGKELFVESIEVE